MSYNQFPGYACWARSRKWITIILLLLVSGNEVLRAQIFFNEQPYDTLMSGIRHAPDTHKINTVYRHARAIIDIHIDSASRMFQQTLIWSRQIQYNEGIAGSIISLADCERLKSNYEVSLRLAGQAVPYCLQTPNIIYILYYYKCIVEDYTRLGYTDSAIHYCYKALDQIRKLPDDNTYDQFKWYFNGRLGSLFIPIYNGGYNDFYRALYYLGLSRDLALKHNNKKHLIRVYLSLGAVYANQANRDSIPDVEGYLKGIYYYQQAASLSKEVGYDINLGDAYFNQGVIYVNRNMVDSGEYFIKKAMALPAYAQYKESKIISYAVLGLAYYKMRKYKKAEQYLLKAKKGSEAIHYNIRLIEIEHILYLIYKERKQNNEALAHLEAYTMLRDSMIDRQKINATAELEVKYRTAEKDKELALKNLKLSRQQSQLREKNILIGSGLICFLLLTGFLFVLYRNMLHRRRRQEEQLHLMEQKQQLWKQGEEIRNLNAMVKGEEKERARLGRELHDGIVGELTAAKMNFKAIQNKYPLPELRADFEAALQHLGETALELRKTAHNLMPEILIQQGLVTAVDSFCEKTGTFTGIRIDFHHDGFIPRMNMDFELSVYRMIQELVQNIIKHANATEALVQLDYHSPLLIITVEDNGVGIEAGEMTRTRGIGLNNLRTRVKALQGNFDITGNKGEGTSVYIEFDISLIKQAIEI